MLNIRQGVSRRPSNVSPWASPPRAFRLCRHGHAFGGIGIGGRILPASTVEPVCARPALQDVIAAATPEKIVARAAGKSVGLTVAGQDVVVIGASKVFDVDERVAFGMAVSDYGAGKPDVDAYIGILVTSGVVAWAAVQQVRAGPPIRISLPARPSRRFTALLPIITSLPNPAMTFSINTSRAITRLLFNPYTSEIPSGRRSTRWSSRSVRRSSVSLPPLSYRVSEFDVLGLALSNSGASGVPTFS